MNNEFVRTRIWQEEPELGNEFGTRVARCHGYDVYGEMLGQARWVDMIYLLFRGEAPSTAEADLLETLAVAFANPGPRDLSVHAAMCGGVGGSPSASCLMAALAVGAGELGGGREVFMAMEFWNTCDTDLNTWHSKLNKTPDTKASIWPIPEHPIGFAPHGDIVTTPALQTLECLAKLSPGHRLPWLAENRSSLEKIAGFPLAFSGIAAAALADLGFTPEQGEMLHLLLRLPGAAAHALEQRHHGYKKFPFFKIELNTNQGEDA